MRALLALLPGEDLPGLRRQLASGETLPGGDLLGDYMTEYLQATERRLHPPSVTGVKALGQGQWPWPWAPGQGRK